jgi:beta-mannanase
MLAKNHDIATPPLILSTSADGPMLPPSSSIMATPTPRTVTFNTQIPNDNTSSTTESDSEQCLIGNRARKTENQKQNDRIMALLDKIHEADKERMAWEKERMEEEEERRAWEKERYEREAAAHRRYQDRIDKLVDSLKHCARCWN